MFTLYDERIGNSYTLLWAQDVRNVVNNKVFKMDYSVFISRWLSNCVLRTTSDEIKAKFRELENCKLKIIKEKSHLIFNETYLRNDLLPVYTNIYIYIYIQMRYITI